MRHPREDNFDRMIADYCAEVDGKPMGILPEAVKAIIATVNPEWRTDFQDIERECYGLTGIPLWAARGIQPGISPAHLRADAQLTLKLTVLAIRTLLKAGGRDATGRALFNLRDQNTGQEYAHSGGDGYQAVFRAWGLQWGTSTWRDAKPHFLYFANQPKQPDFYRPDELMR